MKRARKLNLPASAGTPLHPLTRLKLRVQQMPPEEAEQLFEQSSLLSGAQWRAMVARTLGINLSSDSKVTNFRKWYSDWQNLLEWNASLEQEELKMAESGATPEEIRRQVILKTYARAEAQGDSELALKTVDRDLSSQDLTRKERELKLKTEALAQAERKLKLLEEKEARAQLAKEQLTSLAKGGGLTPEALKQIEEAAALL